MSVELALWMFHALWLRTSPGIAGACSLPSVDFELTAVRFHFIRPLESGS